MTEKNPTGDDEEKYLTLVDKIPSLTRRPQDESASARTISTRELSENLQQTRDGLEDLMRTRKRQYDERYGAYSSSDNEDDETGNFGIPIRLKKSGASGKDQPSIDTLSELTGKKRKRGEHGSQEYGSGSGQSEEDGESSRRKNRKVDRCIYTQFSKKFKKMKFDTERNG